MAGFAQTRYVFSFAWSSGVLAALTAASALTAQEISGRLRTPEVGRALRGVAITATRASDGALVARTITGVRGEFLLTVTTDSLLIRALRIGQQPVVLAHVRLAVGERRRIDADVPDAPVTLAVHRTRATDRCQLRTADGDVVGQLFSAARAALLASGASTDDAPPKSAYRLVREQWNARGERVDSLTEVEMREVEALRPFRSVPVDSLLESGWVVPQPDGSTLYRGLDAEVLLDDRFLARYCLRLAPDSATGSATLADVVGVRFEPAQRKRGRADIEGVLWLDRGSLALRTLTFRYTDLDPVAAATGPGGRIDFASLPGGVWFISSWSLRMPLVYRRVDVAPRSMVDPTPIVSERRTLLGRLEQAGQVLWVEAGGRVQFLRPEPLAIANTNAAPAMNDDQSCRLHGQLRAVDGSPLPSVILELLEHTRAPDRGPPRLLDIARTDSAGRFALCAAGSSRPIILRTSSASFGVDSVVVGPVPAAGLHGLSLIRSDVGFIVPAASVGEYVVDAESQTSALGRQQEREANDRQIPRSDSGGASGESMHAARTVAPSRLTVSLKWLQVTDRDSISIPFATVSIDGGNRRMTTGDGRVALPAGVSGPIDLEVRRIGYAPFVGRVAPDTSDGTYRVRLLPAEQTLAAVEVVAPRQTALSRTGSTTGRSGCVVVRLLAHSSPPRISSDDRLEVSVISSPGCSTSGGMARGRRDARAASTRC